MKRAVSAVIGLPRLLLTGLVLAYRKLLSPMLGPRCRFYPSCSTYALDALQVHGAAKGTALAVARVCRCHPWNPGGVDHVPAKGAWKPEPYVPLTSFEDVPSPADSTRTPHDRSAA